MKFVFQILIFFISSVVFGQIEDVEAKIVTNTIDNFIDIKGVAINNELTFKEGFSYLLFSLKEGANGNLSRNSQSGEFSLKPEEEIELSKLSVNIQKGEKCKVYFFIRKNNELVSKDSTVIFSAEEVKVKEIIEEDSIELKGLVFEDVKTKIGKDFYDTFYQNYLGAGANYPFIVYIDEKPSVGISSKITVTADDRVLLEFMTRPDQEFIELAAKQTLLKIKSYATKRKLLYKNKKF
ncbi:CsgE family curli-type amyloid fiber assembly protein [Lutibacter sp. TH_r2]|uniref:CsgE family curli-type amyloid fiber assembly protein n=1 Tax=Lutibacter sp. TH_r2 TaxID=3082083 RepID=UPI0029541FCF|nr:CsgE family curli-type amyloid fiber assembly protein [Lutibacter sp. TH_r2]MDV7187607.1 CsgE family curli-type amyloid fiber assembly protein [Lutibacter sp. TH_r2]